MLSWPQATLDYFPYIDKKVRMVRKIIHTTGDEHADIIKSGIDAASRMDFYKLGFLFAQVGALSYLAFIVVKRNKVLQKRFIGRVKLRLLKTNARAGLRDCPPVNLT